MISFSFVSLLSTVFVCTPLSDHWEQATYSIHFSTNYKVDESLIISEKLLSNYNNNGMVVQPVSSPYYS